jgi:hypothetical protein
MKVATQWYPAQCTFWPVDRGQLISTGVIASVPAEAFFVLTYLTKSVAKVHCVV